MTDGRGPLPGDGRALRSVALQFWVNGVVLASFIPRLPELRTQIGVDLAGLGLLLTLGSLGGLVGSAAGGALIGRYRSKWTMTGGAMGMIAILPVVGLARSPLVLLVALALMSAFDAVTDMSMNLQGSWISGRRRVPVMSRLHGLWSIGMLLGGAATSTAATVLSLRTHLILVSLVLAATLAYVTPGLLPHDDLDPTSGPDHDRPTPGPLAPATAPAAAPAPIAEAGRGATRRLGLTFAILAMATIGLELVPGDWAALRFTDDFGVGSGVAGLGFVALSAGMVVSRLGGDSAAARFGPRPVARYATMLATFGLGVAALVPHPMISMAGFALCGLGGGVLFPSLYEQAARAPGRPGVMLGALTAGIRIGIIVMPVSVGALAATSLPVGAAMAIVALPGALLLLVARDRLPIGPSRADSTSSARS